MKEGNHFKLGIVSWNKTCVINGVALHIFGCQEIIWTFKDWKGETGSLII